MSTASGLKRKKPAEATGQEVSEASLSLPVRLPHRAGPTSEIVALTDPQGARAEAVRALRTHIIAQHVHGGRRALAVCAASEGVGCTFVAVNLAVALSQIGIKTLLIDANLRHPAIDAFFSPAVSGPGLRHFLASSEVAFTDVIESEVLPELSILRSGGVASNPQELLAGDRFKDLMDVCLRDYAVTILDTPPANSCADARRISNVVGYSLVVARRDRSLVGDVKTLIDELQGDHARVIGTVLNEA